MGRCAMTREPAKRQTSAPCAQRAAAEPSSAPPDGAAARLAGARHSFASISVGAQRQGRGSGGRTAPPTDRKALFCHQCEQQKTFNVGYYLQAETEIRMDNTTFASVFLGTHNMKLNASAAGVIPTVYDEEKKKLSRIESVADLCDAIKRLQDQNAYPPSSGALPVFFIPFGKQLRGSSADTLGWHIANINSHCTDLVGPLKGSRVVLVDVDPEGKTCAKVLLHEMSHAVGNVDVPDSPMIMGPCDPAAPQTPPIPCDPDGKPNLMTATEVKKFCA